MELAYNLITPCARPLAISLQSDFHCQFPGGRGGDSTPYNGLNLREAPLPKGAPFFRLQEYDEIIKRVGISLVVVYERVGKSVISVCKRAQNG